MSQSAENILRLIVAATHSHIDGRDLLAELHPRKTLDIKRRVDAQETWFEGDWLSGLWRAVKEAKAYLYSAEAEAPAPPHIRESLLETNPARTPPAPIQGGVKP